MKDRQKAIVGGAVIGGCLLVGGWLAPDAGATNVNVSWADHCTGPQTAVTTLTLINTFDQPLVITFDNPMTAYDVTVPANSPLVVTYDEDWHLGSGPQEFDFSVSAKVAILHGDLTHTVKYAFDQCGTTTTTGGSTSTGIPTTRATAPSSTSSSPSSTAGQPSTTPSPSSTPSTNAHGVATSVPTSAASAPSGTLPTTGGTQGTTNALIAGVLVMVGGALVIVARRRAEG